MSKNVLGYMEFEWGVKVLLPLEEAHKIQSILAKHAVGVSNAHTSNYGRVEYTVDFDTPAVLTRNELPIMDARGLTKEQIRKWSEMVNESATTEVIHPKSFIAIHGDDNG